MVCQRRRVLCHSMDVDTYWSINGNKLYTAVWLDPCLCRTVWQPESLSKTGNITQLMLSNDQIWFTRKLSSDFWQNKQKKLLCLHWRESFVCLAKCGLFHKFFPAGARSKRLILIGLNIWKPPDLSTGQHWESVLLPNLDGWKQGETANIGLHWSSGKDDNI